LNREEFWSYGVENSEKFNPHITLLRKETLSPLVQGEKGTCRRGCSLDVRIDNFGLYESNPSKGKNSYKPYWFWTK
jgi:2'-5' RNA ligase